MKRALSLAIVMLTLSRQGSAQTHGEGQPGAGPRPLAGSAKDEARLRFDRGLILYNAGDLDGALAEFALAYRISRHPLVLYNLALVRAALGHAAEAVATFETLRALPGAELAPEHRERARAVYEAQLLRVGTLEVTSNVLNAVVQLDNLDVARTPALGLRLTAGSHLVSVSAPGYEPRHLSVTVAGRSSEKLEVVLEPAPGALARLLPASPVPDVEVSANGVLVGRTPFGSELALRPGHYALDFSRPGYLPVHRELTLGAGSASRLEVPMTPTGDGLANGGVLALAISEPSAIVSADGDPRLDGPQGIGLPLGRHRIQVRRAGFYDVEREVWIRPGRTALEVVLLPTPAYLDDYVRRARALRTVSYVSLAAGAAITLGSVGFLVWNQGEKNDAERAFDEAADAAASLPGGACDSETCEQRLAILVDELDARRGRDVYGWIGVGVGAAVLGTGAVLYFTGADPDRYAPRPRSDVFGSLELRIRGAGLELRGEL